MLIPLTAIYKFWDLQTGPPSFASCIKVISKLSQTFCLKNHHKLFKNFQQKHYEAPPWTNSCAQTTGAWPSLMKKGPSVVTSLTKASHRQKRQWHLLRLMASRKCLSWKKRELVSFQNGNHLLWKKFLSSINQQQCRNMEEWPTGGWSLVDRASQWRSHWTWPPEPPGRRCLRCRWGGSRSQAASGEVANLGPKSSKNWWWLGGWLTGRFCWLGLSRIWVGKEVLVRFVGEISGLCECSCRSIVI